MNPRASFVRLAVILCWVLAGPLAFTQSARVFFATPINLSHNLDDTAISYSTHVALDAYGNINVVWAEYDCLQVSPFTCIWHLYYTRSTDAAVTFSAPKDIANPLPGNSLYGPQIAVDAEGRIDVAWEGITSGDDIYFARSIDGGNTFSQPLNVSLEDGEASSPRMALDAAGNINLVWESFDSNTQASSTLFSRSTDGINFSAPNDLCSAGESCESPEIAIDSRGHITIAWAASSCLECSEDVFFTQSTNAGTSFSIPVNLSNDPNPLVSLPQIMATPKGNLNVVWSKGNTGTTEVYFTTSTNGGTSFSTPMVLSTISGDSSYPQLATGPARFFDESRSGRKRSQGSAKNSRKNLRAQCDAINAAWYNNVAGEVFFSRSINQGSSFTTPKPVSTPTGGFGTEPYMAVDRDGRVNIVWQDAATNNIVFTRSNDGGSSFSKPRTISSSPGFSFSPQIAIDLIGNLNVTWFDSTTPIEDVFFARGTSLNLLRKEVAALPASDFRGQKQQQVLNLLLKAKHDLNPKDHTQAVADLTNLLQHVNGCGISPDSNDWVVECAPQLKLRSSLNILINGLSH